MEYRLFLPLLLGFFITFISMPSWIKKAYKIGLIWKDMNKFKINFFTEGNWEGQIPRTHVDMRNDSAWMCALGANHYPLIKFNKVRRSI